MIITATNGENITNRVRGLNSNDVLVLDGENFPCSESRIAGKSDVTIVAKECWSGTQIIRDRNIVKGDPFAKTVTQPKTKIDFDSVRRGLTTNECARFRMAGLLLKGGGWRPENCADFDVVDTGFTGSRYAGIELDGYVQGNNEGTLGSRTRGGKLERCVAIRNACSGFNFSWQIGLKFNELYTTDNNYGVNFDPDPGNTRQVNGKWYAWVQNAGGGNKCSGLSGMRGTNYAAWDNVGMGQWYDWLCSDCIIDGIVCIDPKWVNNDYDATNIQAEIVGPGIIYRNGYVRGGVIGTNVCESHGVRFENFDYDNQQANHRTLRDDKTGQLRNGGTYEIDYIGVRFIGPGQFNYWGGEGRIGTAGTQFNQPRTALRFNKWLGGNTTPLPAPDPIPDPQPEQPNMPASPAGTTVVDPNGKIIDKAGAVWTLTAGKQVARNGSIMSETNSVDRLVYFNEHVHQTAHGSWWLYDGAKWVTTTVPGTTPTTPTTPTDPGAGAPTTTETELTIPVPFDGGTVQIKRTFKVTAVGARSIALK